MDLTTEQTSTQRMAKIANDLTPQDDIAWIDLADARWLFDRCRTLEAENDALRSVYEAAKRIRHRAHDQDEGCSLCDAIRRANRELQQPPPPGV